MLAFYEQIMYNVITTKQNIIKKNKEELHYVKEFTG